MRSKDCEKNDYGLNLDLKSSHPNNEFKSQGKWVQSLKCPFYVPHTLQHCNLSKKYSKVSLEHKEALLQLTDQQCNTGGYNNSTSSCVIRDRGAGSWLNPLKWARAAARALVPCFASRASAVDKKIFATSGSTLLITAVAAWLLACNTSSICGAPIRSNLQPTSFSMFFIVRICLSEYIKIAVPTFPARPVRPERCTNVSGSLGIS